METKQELFPDYEIKEEERLYVIGNGFDVHHGIDSKYVDFKKWLMRNHNGRLIGLMTSHSRMCSIFMEAD